MRRNSGLRQITICTLFCLSVFYSFGSDALDRQPILGGTLAPAGDYPEVARIIAGGFLCSGTLVSPRHILTAAHCFYDDNNHRAVSDQGAIVEINGLSLRSTKITIHPAYVSRSAGCLEDELDAALVEVGSDVTGVDPVPLQKTSVPNGSNLLLVGYGYQGSGTRGEIDHILPPAGYLNYGHAILDSKSKTYLEWTFKSGESNTASGDSGGPAFIENGDSTLALVGITCGGYDYAQFGTKSFDTRADRIVSWVDAVTGVDTPNSPPTLEGPKSISGVVGKALNVDFQFGGATLTALNADNLPPGLTLIGTKLKGTPQKPGSYTLKLTAINSVSKVSFNIPIKVTSSPASLHLSKVMLILSSRSSGTNSLIANGSINLGAIESPKNKLVQIKIGRFSKQCQLDSKGRCGTLFSLTGNIVAQHFTSQKVGVNLLIKSGELLKDLAILGFSSKPAAGTSASLPVHITVDGISVFQTLKLKFKASGSQWTL